MARNLVLIGNGFDLAHGLKTSYSDFIGNYLGKIVKDVNHYGKYEDDDWTIDVPHIVGSARAAITPNDLMQSTRGVSCTNLFLVEIWKLAMSKTQKSLLWADLEGIYYKRIRDLVEYHDKLRSKSIVDLNRGFETIKNLLIEYLVAENISVNKMIDNGEQPFLHKLKGIWESQKHESLVINFNYTSTLKLYDDEFGPDNIINFHGSLDNMEFNPIIFGFGDTKDDHYTEIENLNDNRFLKYSKSIEYLNTNNYQQLLNFIDRGAILKYNVHVIGLSCGITDRVLLNTIMEHDNCESIKVYHYRDRSNFIETVTNISRVFNDKQKFSKRLIPFDDGNKFSG